MDRKLIAGIILAAGRGKRMALEGANKVTVKLHNKPIIKHITDFMRKIKLEKVVVVVGHESESVKRVLADEGIIFAKQGEQLGTGDALAVALEALPSEIEHVLVVYGDDGVLYSEQNASTIERLFDAHQEHKSAITFLTIEIENPLGLGRIVRNKEGEIRSIVEEKDASEAQKQIREINPGCFLFRVSFLREYLPKVEKSPVTGEYYLTSLIDLAINAHEVVKTVKGGKLSWRGVNTQEELEQAEEMFH